MLCDSIFFTVSRFKTHSQLFFFFHTRLSFWRNALLEYTKSVRKMTCDVLEMMTDGLGIKPRNTLSKLVSGENTDSIIQA